MTYRYTGGAGLGETHADPDGVPLAHRDAGDGPAASMAELDMPDGTLVELEPDRDGDSDQETITWTDQFGTPRRTTVGKPFFAANFTQEG